MSNQRITHTCECKVCGRTIEPEPVASGDGRNMPPLTESERRKFSGIAEYLITVIDFRLDEMRETRGELAAIDADDPSSTDNSKWRWCINQLGHYRSQRKAFVWLHKILEQYRVHRESDNSIYELD